MLTIAIPTYNRNERLNGSLRLLLPQLQPHASFCRLLLLDNCSPVPIADTLPAVLNDFPEIDCQVIRNKTNIGANANILRCFEMCESEWIWCLSDDDPVLPNALATICQHLSAYPDCLYFNFPHDSYRQSTYLTTGIEEFIALLDKSANLPWISSSVHRTANIQANIKYGYQFAYSMLPHVAALLISLGSQGRCCMAATQIMGLDPTPPPFEERWSIVSFALGSPTIYDIPLPSASRKLLAHKLLVTNIGGESISLGVVVAQLLLSYFQGNERTERFDKGNLLYHFDQIVGRTYYFHRRFGRRRLQMMRYRLMLQFPRLAVKLLKYFNSTMLTSEARQDRYERI